MFHHPVNGLPLKVSQGDTPPICNAILLQKCAVPEKGYIHAEKISKLTNFKFERHLQRNIIRNHLDVSGLNVVLVC